MDGFPSVLEIFEKPSHWPKVWRLLECSHSLQKGLVEEFYYHSTFDYVKRNIANMPCQVLLLSTIV